MSKLTISVQSSRFFSQKKCEKIIAEHPNVSLLQNRASLLKLCNFWDSLSPICRKKATILWQLLSKRPELAPFQISIANRTVEKSDRHQKILGYQKYCWDCYQICIPICSDGKFAKIFFERDFSFENRFRASSEKPFDWSKNFNATLSELHPKRSMGQFEKERIFFKLSNFLKTLSETILAFRWKLYASFAQIEFCVERNSLWCTEKRKHNHSELTSPGEKG